MKLSVRTIHSGTIQAFHGQVIPTGWLLCDGSTVSRANYKALFDAIGVSSGAGDGATTFHLPDFRGRFLRGHDGTAGRDTDSVFKLKSAASGLKTIVAAWRV